MHRTIARLIPLVVLGVVLLWPSSAEAIVLITHGDTVAHLGEPTVDAKTALREAGASDMKVGYFYSYFGIFWIDIWTWGGTHCLYNDGDEYIELKPAQAADAMGVSENQIGKPFLYRFPPGLMIIVVLVAVGIVAKYRQKAANQKLQDELDEILNDSRYQRALEIMQEHAEKEDADSDDTEEQTEDAVETSEDGGFSEAIDHLVSQGIPRQEAEQKLMTVIGILTAAAQEE